MYENAVVNYSLTFSTLSAEAFLALGDGGGSGGRWASPLRRWGGLRQTLRAGKHHHSWWWFIHEIADSPGPQVQQTGFHLQATTFTKLIPLLHFLDAEYWNSFFSKNRVPKKKSFLLITLFNSNCYTFLHSVHFTNTEKKRKQKNYSCLSFQLWEKSRAIWSCIWTVKQT